jgi:4-amino-4-deoxy-L-arabinose transferase-like glycosyltransferase
LPVTSVIVQLLEKACGTREVRQLNWKATRDVIVILGLAVAVRLVFVFTLENHLYWPDEIDFNNIALGLLQGNGYQSDPFRANPVLPLFLTAVYKLFGYGYVAPRVIQSVLGALTACIVFVLAKSLFSRRVALLAGLGVALYPSLIYISGFFYVSSVETFLLALSVYLLSLSSKKDSFLFLLLSGLVIGITALCRPASLALLPFTVCFVLLAFAGSIFRRTLFSVSLVFIVSLTILPWTVRNYAVYKRVIPMSTGSGLFLWRGNNELAQGGSDDRYLDPGAGEVWTSRLQELEPHRRESVMQTYAKVRQDLKALDPAGYDRYLLRLALVYMAEHPFRSIGLFIHKVGTLYTAFTPLRAENVEFISTKKRFVFSLLYYPTLLLGAFGAVYGMREWRKYLLLYLPIIALTLGYGMLTAAARFRVPIEPYIIVFASYGASVIFDLLCAVRPGAQRERHQPDSLSGAA